MAGALQVRPSPLAKTESVSRTDVVPPTKPESVTVAASTHYRAGALQRWFAGGTNRDLWATPIRVPVLDWQTYDGGLHPTKEGGGMQTKSLRFETPTGAEYVFRLSDKTANGAPEQFKNTPLDGILQDQVSAQHPAAAQISATILEASGVLHPSAVLVVIADDSALGKYRAEYAGRLGMIERFPNVPKTGPGFGGATKIIDSPDLLLLLNTDPAQHVDARAFLAARLTDLLINDNDRHAGNWKWARLASGGTTTWKPIARDRDHAFVSYEGMLIKIAMLAKTTLVSFGNTPNVPGLTYPRALDARLLAELDKPTWDSVARALQARITDSVINAAARAMPIEYRASAPELQAILKSRRAALPSTTDQFYTLLARRVEVHGTDSADRAVITRVTERFVDVRLEAQGKPFFSRRFDTHETSEILVYLHGGDDTALVTGHVPRSNTVRVIGGNGANRLIDSSTVADNAHATRLYGSGTITGVSYGLDTLFDRRPWESPRGELTPPGPDHGGRYLPLVGVTFEHAIGFTPRIGVVRYAYGFDQRPYASMVALEGEYAPRIHGARFTITADQRLESSPLHFMAIARVSNLEVVNFNGLGNATIDSGGTSNYFNVRQSQWLLHPAIAVALGSRMDVSIGPVIQHSVTEAGRNRYLTATDAFGLGSSPAGSEVYPSMTM
jgi:hypothetical protein